MTFILLGLPDRFFFRGRNIGGADAYGKSQFYPGEINYIFENTNIIENRRVWLKAPFRITGQFGDFDLGPEFDLVDNFIESGIVTILAFLPQLLSQFR